MVSFRLEGTDEIRQTIVDSMNFLTAVLSNTLSSSNSGTEWLINPMRFAGRPDLAEPEHVVTAAAAELPALFPASHWITDLRGRSFEDRGMVVRYRVRAQHSCDRG